MSKDVASAGKRTVEKAKETVAAHKERRLYIEDLKKENEPESGDEPELPSSESFSKKKHVDFFDDEVYTKPEKTVKKAGKKPAGKQDEEDQDEDDIVFDSYEPEDKTKK
jgi:hypothetical protein